MSESETTRAPVSDDPRRYSARFLESSNHAVSGGVEVRPDGVARHWYCVSGEFRVRPTPPLIPRPTPRNA